MAGRIILSSKWRHLAMLSYEAEADLLRDLVPPGLELDSWNGKHFITVVGVEISEARIGGIRVPAFGRLLQINLRTYVRRLIDREWRQGVFFLRQFVSRGMAARIAGSVYALPSKAHPMLQRVRSDTEGDLHVSYYWLTARWNSLAIRTAGARREPEDLERFLMERYWGYSSPGWEELVEFRVEHPTWKVMTAGGAHLDVDIRDVYGEPFEEILGPAPTIAFLAEGSQAGLYTPTKHRIRE